MPVSLRRSSAEGNPDSWADVNRLPLMSQKQYYSKTTYGYGHEAYAYVENIRKYHISLAGYLLEKEKQVAQEEKYAEPGSSPCRTCYSELRAFSFRAFFSRRRARKTLF